MNNSWLQYSTTSNKVISSYLQGFLSISGNIILRNQGMNILNGDISANGNLYLTTNNFMQLQNDEIASYIQSGTTFSTGSSSDIVMTGIQKTPEYMRIKGTTGYIGIKTTTPSYYLHVNGSSFFSVSPIMVGNNIYSGTYNDGKYNTSMGINSLLKFATNLNTNGVNNSSFGFNSAFSLTSNSTYNFGNNSTFGVSSFFLNTSGYNNTIFGYYCSNGTQTIQDCIFGVNSGLYPSNFQANYYNTNINVNNNIAFGGVSLTSTNYTSYNNIAFGNSSYTNFNSNSQNNIFFGVNTGNSCINGNNIVIGCPNIPIQPIDNTININIFNPINYSDPLLWYDSQDITTLYDNAGNQTTVGGFIKTIKNKAPNYIGENNLISINASGTTAMYSQKTIGGNTYLLVDLSNSNESGFYTSGSPIMSNGFSCFCVCMIIKDSANSFFLNKTNNNIPLPFDSYSTTRVFGNGVEYYSVGVNANPNNPFNFQSPTTVPHINYIEFDYVNMNYNEYLNGSLIMKYNFNTQRKNDILEGIPLIPVDNNTSPLYLFGRVDNLGTNSVYLFEFVFFNKNITTQNRLLIEGYLAWKYKIQSNLPITHPYYSTNPTALSATTVLGVFSNKNLNNNNISIGFESLGKNTNGQNNNAVGVGALAINTIGSFNSSYGYQSLNKNTTGNYNNAFGYQCLIYNTTGNHNNSFGYQTLNNNETGNYNCASGTGSLYNNWTGNYNCAFGGSSMKSSTTTFKSTTSFNSIFGESSYKVNSSGYNNCVFGAQSLSNNSSGINNTVIGRGSLLTAGGSNNIVLGGNSLTNTMITVNNNIIVGQSAGKGSIGSQNVIIGYNICNNTSGIGNNYSLFGANTCYNGLNIEQCCVAGYETLINSNSVNQCVYGYNSGYKLTTSPNNVAMGPNSLYSLNYTAETNGNNIAIGSSALYYCASGNYNISIGKNSGLNTIIKENNIFIGNNTKLSSSDAWGNSVAIGHDATITDNNQVVLGTTTTTVYVLGSMRVMGNTFIRNSLISSDYRIKQNVIELDETYTTNILQPSSYLNVMTKNREFGFIADDIHEKYPVLTNEIGEEKLKYVNYNGITCISINDLKNLKKMIEKQKIKIANQKKEMENILFDHCPFQPTEPLLNEI